MDNPVESNESPTQRMSALSGTITRDLSACIGWYLFWFLLVLYLYWPGIIVFLKKDHPILMLGRHLVENDFRWFLDMLAYNRTRILQPGDYFAFRPLHHGIIALEDIFFRYDLRAQGIICCSLFAFAATCFFSLARKLAGFAAGFTLTLLWVSQLAGAEIVIWQHINPYVLVPGGLCLAVLLTADENRSTVKTVFAGISVLAVCLSHEIGVLISGALAATVLLLDRGARRNWRLVSVFLTPLVIAVIWNALDYYVIHPAPSFMGPADNLSRRPASFLIDSIMPVAGAAGISMFSPGNIHPYYIEGWFMFWTFMGESKTALFVCGVMVALIVAASTLFMLVKGWRERISMCSLAMAMFLLLFGTVFTVSCFRVFTREISYMYGAPYYFSLFSAGLCGMLALLLPLVRNAPLRSTAVALLFLLAIRQGYVLRSELGVTEPAKKATYSRLEAMRKTLIQTPGICFQGMDTTIVPNSEIRYWPPLFQDVSCSSRPAARPLYMSQKQGMFALTMLDYIEDPVRYDFYPMLLNGSIPYPGNTTLRALHVSSTGLTYGHSVEFTLHDSEAFSIGISAANTSYGFQIDYNTVYNISFDRQIISNTLNWVPGRQPTTYKIAALGESLFLFGNGSLLSVINNVRISPNEQVIVDIASSSKKQIVISNFMAARTRATMNSVAAYIF